MVRFLQALVLKQVTFDSRGGAFFAQIALFLLPKLTDDRILVDSMYGRTEPVRSDRVHIEESVRRGEEDGQEKETFDPEEGSYDDPEKPKDQRTQEKGG